MIYRGDKGRTEAYYKYFLAVEPELAKVRDGFRDKLLDNMAVRTWCENHFGHSRFNNDWLKLFGTHNSAIPGAIHTWDAWIEKQPVGYLKLYYDPEVVAACVMNLKEE